MNKIVEWMDICKTHWKEIFALSFMLHFFMDLFVIGPLFYVAGAIFGLDWVHTH
jgi:hypothetical protein